MLTWKPLTVRPDFDYDYAVSDLPQANGSRQSIVLIYDPATGWHGRCATEMSNGPRNAIGKSVLGTVGNATIECHEIVSTPDVTEEAG